MIELATIERWLQDQVARINQESEILLGIHFSTPPPVYQSRFRMASFSERSPAPPPQRAFSEEKPLGPVRKRSGFLERVLPWIEERRRAAFSEAEDLYRQELQRWEAARATFEMGQAALHEKYRQLFDDWKQRKTSFDEDQQKQQSSNEAKLLAEPDFMAETLGAVLGELEWPLETMINFDIADAGRLVLLDVDLPEIEDVPGAVARLAANKRRLLKKQKSQSILRQEYAKHIHAIGFRLVGEVFRTLPGVAIAIVSAYSQRIDKATGRTTDDYLYSVEVDREMFGNVDFSSLEKVNPVAALAAFPIQRRMTKSGVFKPIDPFVEPGKTSSETGVRDSNQSSLSNVEPKRHSVEAAGCVDGSHYTDFVERVKQLKRAERHEEAIALLLKLVEAIEEESRAAGEGWGVAPWYFEQLAILYRKEKRYADEVSILERYEAQPKAPGAGPMRLAERLEKARQKLVGQRQSGV